MPQAGPAHLDTALTCQKGPHGVWDPQSPACQGSPSLHVCATECRGCHWACAGLCVLNIIMLVTVSLKGLGIHGDLCRSTWTPPQVTTAKSLPWCRGPSGPGSPSTTETLALCAPCTHQRLPGSTCPCTWEGGGSTAMAFSGLSIREGKARPPRAAML